MRAILFLILFIAEGCFISISAQGSDQRILEQLDKAIYSVENSSIYTCIIRLILPAIIFTVKNTTTLSSLSRRETSKFPSIGQK